MQTRECLNQRGKEHRGVFINADLSYHSTHKFGHRHIHYGFDHAESVADLKAASMNAMHSSIEIADQFYSVLRDEELKSRISTLSKSDKPKGQQDIVKRIEALLAELKRGTA